MREKLSGLLFFGLLAAVVALLSYLWDTGSEASSDCEMRGGIYIQTYSGYECVNLEKR